MKYLILGDNKQTISSNVQHQAVSKNEALFQEIAPRFMYLSIISI